MENVQRIVAANGLQNVKSYVLDWSSPPEVAQKFDTIIASDCVYFERYHCIIDCMEKLIVEGGTVYLAAPKRKGSLELFLSKVNRDKWNVLLVENPMWNAALQKSRSAAAEKGAPQEFDEDLHFPRLVILNRIIWQ
ncbi:hypothetical protein L596_003062 [Steinernema carpocapsae]|uniref:Calmodulin-lysine N-methyltransferase n=1 Tax=Steinernema carpocapsae TaxID=34508 RepID=A0A4U8UV91_STECR|nr:hypothetical protein L596_003062 [Steinernema carpocapsae]